MKKSIAIFVATFAVWTANAEECVWCQTLSLGSGGGIESAELRFSWTQGEAETNKVDLLFAFDSAARAWLAENGWSEETFADEVVFEMNSGISLTGLDECFTFRLAGLYDIATDLSGLSMLNVCKYSSGVIHKKGYEEHLAPMREYRNAVAADIVVVLTEPDSQGIRGISLEMDSSCLTKSGMLYMANHAYSAVDISTAFTRHTALHEVGHIFGAGHSDTQKSDPGPQLFKYSAGYNYAVGGEKYATVMSYVTKDADGNLTPVRMPFFSSPDYLHDGVPVGTRDKNDNTRTLRETFKYVANFRVKTYLPGYGPSGGGTDVDDTAGDIELKIRDEEGLLVNEGETVKLNQFENTEFSVSAECWTMEKTTIKVAGLPAGMKYSSKTGKISGYAKKSGTFSVNVKATAKGKTAEARRFTLSVAAIPDAVIGSYAGLVSSDATGDVIATATLSKTGRVTVKMKYQGLNRTFSCNGFGNVGNGAWVASPTVNIKKAAQTLNAIFDKDGRAVSIAGFSGRLFQNAWGRKDISAPVFKKAIKQDVGDLKMRLYGKGKVRISGVIDGIRVSGTFQLVAGTPSGGYQKDMWSLPVAFPAKRNFQGWANWFAVDLTVDASNRVAGSDVEALEICKKTNKKGENNESNETE